MKRTARIALAPALLIGGATLAMAQNDYPPARWNADFYYNYRPYYATFYYYPSAPTYRYMGLGSRRH
jgi:hypothetical protein